MDTTERLTVSGALRHPWILVGYTVILIRLQGRSWNYLFCVFQGLGETAEASTPEDVQRLKHGKLVELLEDYRTLQKEQQLALQQAQAIENGQQ